MPSKIDGIIIGTYKGDFWLTKICVASIRYWYPEIPIYIYKDLARGDFKTAQLQQYWNVKIIELEQKTFGSPLSKLFVNFLSPSQKYLVIDSDIIFLGKVLEKLEEYDHDFIVDKCTIPDNTTTWFKNTYYSAKRIKQIDPDFVYPGYVFNGGQVVVTTGVIKKEEILPFINVKEKITTKDTETYSNFDQGIYNYLLPKLENKGRITLGATSFMIWGEKTYVSAVKMHDVLNKKSNPYLVHWAGTMKPILRKVDGGELLQYFEQQYYSKIPFGFFKRCNLMLKREMRWGVIYDTFRYLRKLSRKNNSVDKTPVL